MSVRLHNIAFGIFCALPLLLVTLRAGAEIATLFIDALFLLHCIASKDWHWTARLEFRVLALLWLFMMATAPLSTDPVICFKTAFYWGRYVLLFFAISCWLLADVQKLVIASNIGLIALAFVALDTGWQYVTGVSLTGHTIMGVRLSGPLGHPNIGNFMLKTGLPMFGVAFFMVQHNRHRFGLALFLLVVMGLIFVSGERSITGLMLLSFVITWMTVFFYQKQFRAGLLLFAIAAIAMFAALATTQHVVQARAQMAAEQLSDFEHSPYGQLFAATRGFFRQHPLIGIGAGGFRDECGNNMEKLGVDYCNVHPHNIYLEWLADSGLIGLGLFIIAILLIVKRAVRDSSFSGKSAFSAAFALSGRIVLIFPFVVTQSVFANWSAILFWYSMALAVSLPRLKETS